MKRALAVAALLLAAGVADAHTNPARRSVALQAEKDAAVVLVQWTVPSGEYGDAYTATASWGRSTAGGRRALEASLAAKAIGPLVLTLDGKPISPRASVKLTEDPPHSGRMAVAVLLTVTLEAGPHELALGLSPGTPELTRFVFVDRSEGRASLADPEPSLLDPARPVRLRW